MSVYDQDPGPGNVRWRVVEPSGNVEVYVEHDGDGLLSDEALKAPPVRSNEYPPPDHREGIRREAFEEAHRFLEEEANVADRTGEFGEALTLRRTLRRMRERLKP
jgi:hypothetical protein